MVLSRAVGVPSEHAPDTDLIARRGLQRIARRPLRPWLQEANADRRSEAGRRAGRAVFSRRYCDMVTAYRSAM